METNEAFDFLESLPVPAGPVAHALFLSMHSRGELRRAVQSLAKRGYIGCLPFAHIGRPPDHIVVRLLPAQSPRDCPIGVVYSWNKALTIAPSLQHFVAGRLALLDAAEWAHNERTQEALLEYAAALGSAESARAVLAACPRVAKEESGVMRSAMLFAAAGEFDPLFEALGGTQMHMFEGLADWIGTLRGQVRSNPIVDRTSVGYHTLYKTGVDVSEPAWRVVMGDHVFDPEYIGSPALRYAVRFLREKGVRDTRMESPEWLGAQAAVDAVSEDEKGPPYGGEVHFDAAREIAADDAAKAYTLLANAALYASRANKPLLPQILKFALELATANKWDTLAATLKLAQAQSRGATAKLTAAKKSRSTRA